MLIVRCRLVDRVGKSILKRNKRELFSLEAQVGPDRNTEVSHSAFEYFISSVSRSGIRSLHRQTKVADKKFHSFPRTQLVRCIVCICTTGLGTHWLASFVEAAEFKAIAPERN